MTAGSCPTAQRCSNKDSHRHKDTIQFKLEWTGSEEVPSALIARAEAGTITKITP